MSQPPKVGGSVFTGGMGATGDTAFTSPTAGGWYNVRQRDTWPGLAQLAYNDPGLWNEIAYANPGKQCKNGERVFIPKRGAPDRLAGDAPRAFNDGAPRTGEPLPAGDPALAGDLNAARTAANVGAPGTQPRTGAPTMNDNGGPWIPDENVHGHGGGSLAVTGGVWRKQARVDAWKAEGKYEGNIGGADVKAQGDVHALSARGEAKAAFGWRTGRMEKKGATTWEEKRYGISEYKGPMFMAEVGARGRAELVGAEGQVSAAYGNDVIQGKTTLRGEAWVGAEAGVKAHVGLSKHGFDAQVGVDAFAGAKIRGAIKQDIGVAGERLGSVGARAEGWAGVGVTAKGYANVGKDENGEYHVKFGGKVGAALGLGGCVRLDIDVNVTGVVNVAKKVGGAVADGAKAVGGAVADGAKAVGNAVSNGWNAVKSIFW